MTDLPDLDTARVEELIARLKPRSGSAPDAKMVAAAAILAHVPTLQVPEACRHAVSIGFDAVPQGSQVRVRPLANKIAALTANDSELRSHGEASPCAAVPKKRGRPALLTPQEKLEAQERHHQAKLEYSRQRTLVEQRRRIERPLEQQLENGIITFIDDSPMGSTPRSSLVNGIRKELRRLSALVAASFKTVGSTPTSPGDCLKIQLSKVGDRNLPMRFTYEPAEQRVIQRRSRVIPDKYEEHCFTTEPRARYHVLTFDCVQRAVKDAHGPRTVQLADGEQLPWGWCGATAPPMQCGLTVKNFEPNVCGRDM